MWSEGRMCGVRGGCVEECVERMCEGVCGEDVWSVRGGCVECEGRMCGGVCGEDMWRSVWGGCVEECEGRMCGGV